MARVAKLRGACFALAGMLACGATGKPKNAGVAMAPMDDTDGGAQWVEGDSCITIGSRSAPIDIPNTVVDGDLHKGRHHCYLDLQRALCVRYAEDAGVGESVVRTLRLSGNCDDQPEVRFRGKLRGTLESIRPDGSDLTVDALASSIEHASRTIDVDTSGASVTHMDLLKSFLLRCWREGTSSAPTTNARLTLDVVVSPAGEVTEARPRDEVGISVAIERCIVKAVRAPQMFLAADAGASRDVSMRISLTLLVAPLQ